MRPTKRNAEENIDKECQVTSLYAVDETEQLSQNGETKWGLDCGKNMISEDMGRRTYVNYVSTVAHLLNLYSSNCPIISIILAVVFDFGITSEVT